MKLYLFSSNSPILKNYINFYCKTLVKQYLINFCNKY